MGDRGEQLADVDAFEATAVELVRQLTGDPLATFREGQLDAIRDLVVHRKRALVVQRTGWGKSAVYFVATRMLRDRGSGPTLLVSPLLSLMRNQIAAARRMGIRAETINSDNYGDWPGIVERVRADEIDLLLISPERLANRRFVEQVLDQVGDKAGLVVVDEAHCISDWGHDFRPDYRRIERVLRLLPAGVPVLACTATANDRVVDDVARQLGTELSVFRGALARGGLALQVIELPAVAARLAWLARTIPELPGSGIVYCLTVRDADTVAEWLRREGIEAAAYRGGSGDNPAIEAALLDNRVKAVVATSALGMGFDKPDLPWVIHFQAPSSVVAYYQQVGRAGRQLATSRGVLLLGREDADIQDWFIDTAFPSVDEAASVVAALEARDGFVKLHEVEGAVNVGQQRLEGILKNLEVDRFVVADGKKYQRTAVPYAYDTERVAAVTALRRSEQAQMRAYGAMTSGCRMRFLSAALDDAGTGPCGICDLCSQSGLSADVDPETAARAAAFVRGRPVAIEPRKRWADLKAIAPGARNEEGRALCRWGDGGWSTLVEQARQRGTVDSALVDALADLVGEWAPSPAPTWVTWVPSASSPAFVAGLAEALGAALGIPAVDAVAKISDTQPQRSMRNSAQQMGNVAGAFAVTGPPPGGPVLLVDDHVDSRWTLTYVGSLLRGRGVEAVHPVVLAHHGAT